MLSKIACYSDASYFFPEQNEDTLSVTPENTLRIDNRIGQDLNFFLSVIEIKTRSQRRTDSQTLVQRHRAVMASPHCHALLVKSLRDVMRMYAVQQEIDNRTFVLNRWAKDTNTLKGI